MRHHTSNLGKVFRNMKSAECFNCPHSLRRTPLPVSEASGKLAGPAWGTTMSWQDSTILPDTVADQGRLREQLIRDTNSFLLFLGSLCIQPTREKRAEARTGRGGEVEGHRAMALGLCPCLSLACLPWAAPALQARKAIRGACCEGAGMIPEPQLPGSPRRT